MEIGHQATESGISVRKVLKRPKTMIPCATYRKHHFAESGGGLCLILQRAAQVVAGESATMSGFNWKSGRPPANGFQAFSGGGFSSGPEPQSLPSSFQKKATPGALLPSKRADRRAKKAGCDFRIDQHYQLQKSLGPPYFTSWLQRWRRSWRLQNSKLTIRSDRH